jgi:hypothetical protein
MCTTKFRVGFSFYTISINAGEQMDMIEKTKRDIELMASKFESNIGIKILMAFKCIYCGKIVDDISDLKHHGVFCPDRKFF